MVRDLCAAFLSFLLQFNIKCDGDDRMSLTAIRDIKAGDEIFIYYGHDFFDTNNAACECFTCELLGRGAFSEPTATAAVAAVATSSTAHQACGADTVSASTTDCSPAASPASLSSALSSSVKPPRQSCAESVAHTIMERLKNG